MNRRQYEYAVKLAKVRSFSALAEELNISQPALSKQIGTLEQELGIKLFDRSTTPLTLTPAGAFVVEEAKDRLFREEQISRTMDKFRSGQAGRLTIGVSPFRCTYRMPRIVKAIKQRYPDVQVVLREDDSAGLRKDAADGRFDLAVLNLPIDESVLDAYPIENERLMLVVPNELADTLPAAPDEPYAQVALTDCGDIPFVVVGESQELRQAFDKMCIKAGIHPTVAVQVKSLSAALEMVSAGVGATVLPLPFLEGALTEKAVTLFTIRDATFTRQSAVVVRRGQYLSEYAQYAIELLTK